MVKTGLLPPATEGYSFTLLVCSHGGWGVSSVQPGGQVQLPGVGVVRSSCWRGGQVQLPGRGSGPAAGGFQVQLLGGVRSSCRWGGQVQLLGGGGSGPAGRGSGPARGVRSSCWGGSGPAGGGQSAGGRSASCALLRVVCLLRSRRRTFLF